LSENLPNFKNETSFHPSRARLFLLLSLGIILYLTLFPFNFGPKQNPFDLSIPFFGSRHHSLSDMLSNFFLFIPLGVFFNWSFPVKGRLLWGCLAGALLSLGVEILQQYLPGRIPSLTDSILNSSGTLAGLVMAQGLRNFWALKPSTPDFLALFLAFYFLYEPFLFTFDWGEIKENLKHLSLILDFKNVFLPSVLLGFFLRRYPLIFAILLVWTFEIGRLFIVSISLKPAKMFLRFILTLFCYTLFRVPKFPLRPLFVGAYLLEALYPFHFAWPSSFPWKHLIPFGLYLSHFSFETFFNLFRELFLFFFWGISGGSVKGALLLATTSETLQLFIPERYFDLTTIILAFLGVFVANKLMPEKKDAL